MDDIAVIGMGLRFPGNATSPEELWKVLERGESQWSEFPKDRLNIDGYYHPGGERQGSVCCQISCNARIFLTIHRSHSAVGTSSRVTSLLSTLRYVQVFKIHLLALLSDSLIPQFFSVAAEDAKAIDPQQRILLEVSYEALENGNCILL